MNVLLVLLGMGAVGYFFGAAAFLIALFLVVLLMGESTSASSSTITGEPRGTESYVIDGYIVED
jgi:hypothetical protein